MLALGLALLAPLLPARIISYAPVTDRVATPAVQHRTNRHYALIEMEFSIPSVLGPIPIPPRSRLVLYDSRGEQEPRIVFPEQDSDAYISFAAVWERGVGTPRFLIETDASLRGDNPGHYRRFLYSADAGQSWKVVPIPAGSFLAPQAIYEDVGGPIARGRGSPVRLGSPDYPFVLFAGSVLGDEPAVYAVGADGSARRLLKLTAEYGTGLIGSNQEGTRFLVAGRRSPAAANAIGILNLGGDFTSLGELPPASYHLLEGWITGDGSAYVENAFPYERTLSYYRGGVRTEVAAGVAFCTDCPGPPPPAPRTLLAIPTADYSGAWIVRLGLSRPTVLLRHAPGAPSVEQWSDISAPEVEALHAGASGRRLLIQVHRARPQVDQRLFIDPALAIWEAGQPAPRQYDELFLNEGQYKAFVHLDVEAMAGGEGFVFDSAAAQSFQIGPMPSPSPAPPGGGDVTQEWGVVRASLKQRLLLPVVTRVGGAYGSFWRTDAVFRNPSDAPLEVRLRYVPTTSPQASKEVLLSLSPREVRVVSDVLLSLFATESGSGALFVTAEGDAAVSMTSRTYTLSERGTFGMGVGPVEILNHASARFALTFSGALLGKDFRTNLLATDAGGRGGEIGLLPAGTSGSAALAPFSFVLPPGGVAQIGGLANMLGFAPHETGAITFAPSSGEAIPALIAVDNRTNDPTYFPPDLPSPYVRTIPAVVHTDGAFGSVWRTDLFLFNPSAQYSSVTLAVRRWNEPENEKILNLTLLPRESKLIRDVLQTAFGLTGIARLRYMSGFSADGNSVRVTSRTYTEDLASGGTFGFLMPPLNSFQSAGSGESLEILGPQGEANFRTNLALVDLTAFPTSPAPQVKIEIFDEKGALVDSFETAVPSAGGVQLGDLFQARGLGNGPVAAVIRVSPFGGLIGAFATMTDNGTNDPVYFAAGLASK